MIRATDYVRERGLTPEAKREIETLFTAVARAPRALLMLDYDGTLAAFQNDRTQAFPYPGIAPVLQAIVRNGKTRVVIISGRDAEDILPLLDVEPQPEVWGLHGLQRLLPDGCSALLPLDKHTLDALAAAATALRIEHLEHTAEFKPGSIAVHWRGLSASDAESVRQRVLTSWAPVAKNTGLHLLEFDGGIEIRPSEVDKGDAVRILIDEMNPNTPVAYLGDDNTDEHAFEAMDGRGLSVLVRPQWRPTAAQFWLTPPHELLDFLNQWLKACQPRQPSPNQNIKEVNA